MPLPAQQAYIANESQGKLVQLDFATGLQTTLYTIGGHPDDLTLNSQGQLIYSVPASGTICLYDPVTGNNTTLVSAIKWVRDLVIEPGGTSMLIGVYSPGQILRYNFVTGTTEVLSKKLGTVDGLAYDPAGHLFAVANHNTIVQIDPASGKVLKTLVLEPHLGVNGGDGMTYDSYTGQLWVTHDGKLPSGPEGGLIEVPTDLSGFTLYQTGKILSPDGIDSDGKGNLYIGAGWYADEYNIPTDTVTKSFVFKGADGISLVPGTY
jgi:WD40 repeat protein